MLNARMMSVFVRKLTFTLFWAAEPTNFGGMPSIMVKIKFSAKNNHIIELSCRC